jgi:hypothetical protein
LEIYQDVLIQIYRLVVVQIEAAAAAAKDAEKAKLVKKKSGNSRGGRQRGGGGSRTRGSSSSSYSRRDAKVRRGETMKSERSRDSSARDSYRNSHRQGNSRKYDNDIETESAMRSLRSQGGKSTLVYWFNGI